MIHIFRKTSKVRSNGSPSADNIMKENQNYIRKRKQVNFTLPDLEADKEEDEDATFEIKNCQPSTSRIVPKRNCTKQTMYQQNRNQSGDDDSFEETYQ